jgi:hypothetical protein
MWRELRSIASQGRSKIANPQGSVSGLRAGRIAYEGSG